MNARVLAVAILSVGGIGCVASADLVNADWHTPGDGLLTHDTVSGLYWLDWTQGLNFSRNAMEAELLQPGSQFAGFRYATVAELQAFCVSGGVPDVGGRTSANIPSVEHILSLLGANDFFSFLGAGNSSAAHLGAPHDAAVFTIETFDSPLTAKAAEPGWAATDTAFGAGHALVSFVPTPGAAAVLGLGGLAAFRRRR